MTSALFSAVDVAAVEATFAVIERFLRRSHMFNDFLIQLSSPQEKERERERERKRGKYANNLSIQNTENHFSLRR